MIEIINLNQETPYLIFKEKYDNALSANQRNIEAISISSFNKNKNEVDSRFVNLKIIEKDEFIFFSNYDSPKSIAFDSNNQISALIFWPSTNLQIRIKAKIKKTSYAYNNEYFKKRHASKNALAISSNQSNVISSYDQVLQKYEDAMKNENLLICPNYWGGYSFKPYEFEFWEGHNFRSNKRDLYKYNNGLWNHSLLEP